MGRLIHGAAIAMFLPASIAASVEGGAGPIASRSLAYDVGGASASFSTAAVLHGANLSLMRGVVKDGGRPHGDAKFEPRVLIYMSLLALFAASYTGISTFVPVRLEGRKPADYAPGGLLLRAAAASPLPRVFLARSPGRINHIAAVSATAATLVGLCLATCAGDLPSFAAASLVYGLGHGAVVTTYQVLALAGSGGAGLSSVVLLNGLESR